MVSFAHLFTIVSVLACVALGNEVSDAKPDNAEEKWWGGYGYGGWLGRGFYGSGLWGYSYYPWLGAYRGFAGCGVLPYYGGWFTKSVDTSSKTRRSHILAGEQLIRRNEAVASCKDQDGKTVQINPKDCQKAANMLVANKASQQSCGTCFLKLVAQDGPVSASGIPADVLAKVADKILNSCSSNGNASNQPTRRSPAEVSPSDKDQQKVAVLVEQGHGNQC